MVIATSIVSSALRSLSTAPVLLAVPSEACESAPVTGSRWPAREYPADRSVVLESPSEPRWVESEAAAAAAVPLVWQWTERPDDAELWR